jgi:hypothetical protein
MNMEDPYSRAVPPRRGADAAPFEVFDRAAEIGADYTGRGLNCNAVRGRGGLPQARDAGVLAPTGRDR